MDRKSITPQAIAAMVFGFIVQCTKVVGLFALAIVAALMALKALGFSIPLRTPPLDQSTGVAIAALAYVLHR